MIFSILTLFPEMFDSPLKISISKRAKEIGSVEFNFINIRDFSHDKYRTVDDHPYGGGTGMILKVDVIDRALQSAKNQFPTLKSHTLLFDPKGKLFSQDVARKFLSYEHLIFICGHYEGVDDRVNKLVDEKLSIGNYILTGGEIPALVVMDSLIRLIPGVLSKPQATIDESFSSNTYEYPQYTRPQEYKGMRVPTVLLSGNHKKIKKWRMSKSKSLVNKYGQ